MSAHVKRAPGMKQLEGSRSSNSEWPREANSRTPMPFLNWRSLVPTVTCGHSYLFNRKTSSLYNAFTLWTHSTVFHHSTLQCASVKSPRFKGGVCNISIPFPPVLQNNACLSLAGNYWTLHPFAMPPLFKYSTVSIVEGLSNGKGDNPAIILSVCDYTPPNFWCQELEKALKPTLSDKRQEA